MTLLGKLADGEDGRLISQNNHLVGAQMPGSFMDQRWEEVRKQNKKDYSILANIPQNGEPQAGERVSFTSLESFTGGQLGLFP